MADQVNTYHGSCECGAFAYELSIPDIKRLMECNCSLCVRKAYSGIFCGPQEQVMKVLNGSMDQLYTYAFGDKTLEHKVSLSRHVLEVSWSLLYKPRYHILCMRREVNECQVLRKVWYTLDNSPTPSAARV